VPGLRRLLHPGAGAAHPARARHSERTDRVHQRHRLLQPVPVLHEHLWHALHPRSRAGHRQRRQDAAARPERVGGHRRRRRPGHRWQSLHPRPAPEHGSQDPDVQQPHLRPHQGAVQPDERAGQEDEVVSPAGAPDYPFNPISVALSAEATFVARAADIDAKGLPAVLERAARHKGSAFIEIYQNCPIFNDGAHDYLTDRKTKAEHELRLEHGKPLRFGPNGEKGIALDARMQPVVVDVADVRRRPPAGARRAERFARLLPQPPGPPRVPDAGRACSAASSAPATISSSTSRSRPPALARSSPYSRPSRPERPGQSPEARVRASRCSPPAESPCPIPGLPRCSFSVSRPSSAPRWCSSPGCSAQGSKVDLTDPTPDLRVR
jgi:hypothetical protein